MAGLIEELITTLEEENQGYKELLLIAKQKSEIIINNDVPNLQAITEREQEVVGQISRLDKQREQLISDIGLVINKDPKELTISVLINLLDKQIKEQASLMRLFKEIKETLDELKMKNEQNKRLLNQSLDFIDFTVNVLKSSLEAPKTANYGKGNTYDNNAGLSMFDARQ